jgi:hypothetical protein
MKDSLCREDGSAIEGRVVVVVVVVVELVSWSLRT